MAVATPPNPLIACQTHGRTKPSPCLNAPRACQRQSCVRRAVAQPNGLTTQAPASSGLPEQQQQVGSRKKRSRRREQAKQNGRTAAPSPTCLWENAYHGYLQKLTPACKNDRQNLQELRAAMRIALKTGGKPDAVSMCLRKLSLLGCYDQPLYSMLTAMLSRALVVWPRMCTPRHVSLALFSCALSRAFDAHVDSVAAWVGRHQEQHLQGWKAQHLSNALFAWAVLSATARGDTPAMRACAQSLFAAANSRGSAGFAVPNDLGKLHWAHLEAQHVGLRGGGLVDVGLQQAAQAEAARVQRSVSEELGGMMQEVAVVLESLGFGVVTMHEEVHMGSGHSEGMVGVCGVKGMEEHGGIRVGLGHGGGPKEEVGRNSAGRGQGISWEGSGRDETGMEWDGTKGCRACEGESKTDSGGISFCIGGCGGNSSALLATPLSTLAVPSAAASVAHSSAVVSVAHPSAASFVTHAATAAPVAHPSAAASVAQPSADAPVVHVATAKTTEHLSNHAHDHAHSLADRPSSPIVVAFTRQQDYARHPAQWLRGKAALRLAHAARVPGVAGVAVMCVEEWALVCGDLGAQRVYLASRMRPQALLGEGCAGLGVNE